MNLLKREKNQVLVLGAGFSGLAAAARLIENGVPCTVLEASPMVGGLGGCTRVAGAEIELTYHHIKPEDTDLISLIETKGLGNKLRWSDTRMAFYVDKAFHRFSTPLDLIRFKPFSLVDRVRFGLGVLKAKRIDGKSLEGLSAEEWVIRDWGKNVYERMMRPMLLNKFGIPPSRISAGFLQGRIKGLSSAKTDVRRGEQLAYLLGGLQPVAEMLADDIRLGGELLLKTPVTRIESGSKGLSVWNGEHRFETRHVVNTLPMTVFESIPKNFDFATGVEYQAAICAIFALDRDITPHYWINVLDDDITFRIVVNQSRVADYEHCMIYCANYVRQDDPLFAKSNEEILELYISSLRRMFGTLSVLDHRVFRTRFATPVFDKDFASKTHDLDRRVPGMVFAGNVKIYPYSRTVSSVIGAGYKAANQVLAKLKSDH